MDLNTASKQDIAALPGVGADYAQTIIDARPFNSKEDLLRKKIILVEDLYRRGSFYEFSGGFNWNAIAALATGCAVAFIGLVYPPLRVLYDYAWFLGFAVSFTVYCALMSARQKRAVSVQPPALSED